jgi:hypothetical protein
MLPVFRSLTRRSFSFNSMALSTSSSSIAATAAIPASTPAAPVTNYVGGAEATAKRIKLAHKLNYRDGLFLAPMVSDSTLQQQQASS